jgi:hypothetical protein
MPTFDAAASGDTLTVTTASDLTWSHTTGVGTNRILIVGVTWTSSATITTVNYGGTITAGVIAGGTNLTLAASQQDATATLHSAQYYLVAPASGTNNVIVKTSGASTIIGGSVSLAAAKQNAPEIATGSIGTSLAISTSVTPLSTSVTLIDNATEASTTSTLAVAAAQTSAWNRPNTTAARTGAGSYQAVTAPAAMTWTISGATSRSWAQSVVSVSDISATATSSPTAHNLTLLGVGQ